MSIKKILSHSQHVAIIGCSSKPYRTSYRIAAYLLENGYRIIPVNPNEKEVHGKPSYPSLMEIPGDISIDMVTIFRNRKYTADMVEEIIQWAAETGQKPVIWTQIGVSSEEAKKRALSQNFDYIEDKCMMVEHKIHF